MIYLLCFKTKFKHAKHYLGFVESADNLDNRMKKHGMGSGSKLMRAVSKAGIEFSIARIWPDGDRNFERYLKNRKEGPRLCPLCNPENALNKGLTMPKKLTVNEESSVVKSIPCDGITVAIETVEDEGQEGIEVY